MLELSYLEAFMVCSLSSIQIAETYEERYIRAVCGLKLNQVCQNSMSQLISVVY